MFSVGSAVLAKEVMLLVLISKMVFVRVVSECCSIYTQPLDTSVGDVLETIYTPIASDVKCILKSSLNCQTAEKCLILCSFPFCHLQLFPLTLMPSQKMCLYSYMWERILCVIAVNFVSLNGACGVPAVRGLKRCGVYLCRLWSSYTAYESYLATFKYDVIKVKA